MCDKIYTIEELQSILVPLAKYYELKELYVFGSYAKGTATTKSDVDILIDRENSKINNLLDLSGFYIDCENGLNKKVDVVTVQALEQEDTKEVSFIMRKRIMAERIKLYERERLPVNITYKKAL